MSTDPYFDRPLTKPALHQLLVNLGARLIKGRGSGPGQVVYGLDGGGEALVERATSKSGAEGLYRVRLYRGRCAC